MLKYFWHFVRKLFNYFASPKIVVLDSLIWKDRFLSEILLITPAFSRKKLLSFKTILIFDCVIMTT